MLHFASFAATLIYIAISLVVYFACGYSLLNRILKVNLHRTYGIIISLPIYLSAGIVFLTFIVYGIGMIILNDLVTYIVAIAVIALFLADTLLMPRKPTNVLKPTESNVKLSEPRKSEEVVAGLVLVLSLAYIATIISLFEWPPHGDAVTHGFLTSLIVYDQRIPTTLSPMISEGLHYPLGLHADAAFLTFLLGIYPGEAVFLFGGVLIIVITSLIFSLTYMLTRSKTLSLIPYVSSYLMFEIGSGGGNLEWWLFGYFFNGPYPNIYAFLIILLSLTGVGIYVKHKDQYVLTRLFPILIIVFVLVYPNLVFFTLLLFIIASVQFGVRKMLRNCFATKTDTIVTALLIASLAYFAFGAYIPTFTAIASSGIIVSTGYEVPPEYVFGSAFGFSILIALFISLSLLVLSFRKETMNRGNRLELKELVALRPLFLAYALMVSTLYLSLNAGLYTWLQYLLPSRTLTAVLLASLVINIYGLNKILNIGEKKPRNLVDRERVDKSNKIVIFAVVVILLFNYNGLMVYSVASHVSLSLASSYGTFSDTTFKSNFGALEWICQNVGPRELILNDWSFSGLYLLSLSIENVTMNPESANSSRTMELQEIWLHPDNMSFVESLLLKYNVSYILVTSELDYINTTGSTWVYEPKPYLPSQYMTIFTGYPFLEIVYISGFSAVFEVK